MGDGATQEEALADAGAAINEVRIFGVNYASK
jgi:hypothetical protein